jgi:hypothetical protein
MHPQMILAGEIVDTAPYYAVMDVAVLPSHREVFPMLSWRRMPPASQLWPLGRDRHAFPRG